jgi:hypothetical protein
VLVDTTAVFELLRRASEDLRRIGQELTKLGVSTALNGPAGRPVPPGGITPEAVKAGRTPRPAGTVWTGKTALTVQRSHECTISVSVDVIGAAVIWTVSVSDLADGLWREPFETGTEPREYAEISDRLQLVIDQLPTIVDHIN